MPSSSVAADDTQAHHETLLTLLHTLARQTPNNDFLIEDADTRLSYRQFYILASQLFPSRLLHLCPILSSPRTRKVMLISANNSLFPLALWALWLMSFTVVPVSVKSEQSLWGAMVDHVGPDALLISRSLKNVAAQHIQQRTNVDVAYLEDIIPFQFALQTSTARQSDFIPSLLKWLSHAMGTEHGPDLELGDPLHVDSNTPVVSLFTSSAVDASTLKSVTYTHAMIIHSTSKLMEALGGSSYSSRPIRHLGWLPLSHCFEFCISFLGIVLRTGGSYIFFDREVSSPSASLSNALHIQLLQAIRYHRTVDSCCLVPAIFAEMIKDIDRVGLEDLKAMRSLGVGGAPTSEDIFKWSVEQGVNYFDCLGATEAAGTICIRRATVRSMCDYGLQVVPGLEGFLEKESLEDVYGELVIRGAFLPTCYDNKESGSFLRDPGTRVVIYRTGDLYEQHVELRKFQTASSYLKGEDLPASKDSESALSGLRYLGRVDDLVILASGVKIDALALERCINAHPCIIRSAVISDMRRETPVVLLQLTIEATRLHDPHRDKEIIQFVLQLNRSLSFDKRIRPENVIIVEELPITTKLTLNRKKVKKIWAESNGKWLVTRNGMEAPSKKTQHLDDQLLVRPETRREIEILLSDIFDIPVEHFSRQCVHFSEMPLTSLSSIQLASALESRFEIKLSASQLYSLRSVDDICNLVVRSDQTGLNNPTLQYERDSSLSDTTRVPTSVESTDSSLVITGVACRYPGKLASPNDLWGALLDPQTYDKKVRKTATTMRWKPEAVRQSDIPPIAWLEDEVFEDLQAFRDFFRLSPSDAESMSPNARLVLQMGYQAIEDAGIAPSSLSGQTWGVFSSVNNSGWRERRSTELNLHDYSASLLGSADDAVGARLSYFLDLTGPAVEIKTACSSSAVAIHQACSSIMNGDCDAAIVISSTTHFHPSGPMFRSQAGIASKSGRCATFSSDADGFFPAEGAAAIVIQKAVDRRCSPHACIKASHIAQDGHSHGFFAPNPTAQAGLISRAINKASCTEDEIDMIEAHGTGTQLGDAVEMQALDNIFLGKRKKPLFIGAVKAVLGHTEEGAGLSSVLKSILCFQNNVIPAQPNLVRPNSQINFARPKFCISRQIVAFPRNGRPRRIGVSSFGLTGTLAHIILEDFDDSRISRSHYTPRLFLLSANDNRSYESLVTRYIEFATSYHALESEIEDICMTSQIGRDHFPLRRAFAVDDHHSWTTLLSKELGEPKPRSCLKPGNIRLGIWFGLPFANTTFGMPDCSVIDQERSLVTKGNWDRRYSSFAQQLITANTLKSLGCQIVVVGGEGMAEWVAGVFAGALRIDSVFQRPVGPEGPESHLLRGPGEILNDLLTQWLPTELSLRGCYTDDLYVLDGTADAARELSQLGDLNLTSYPSLPHAEPPCISQPSPHQTTTFVSGHSSEVVDRDTLRNGAYWARVTKEFFDSSRGIEELEAHCDLVLHIGGPSSLVNRETYVHLGAGKFEDLLGILYERGCNIEWSRFGTDGKRLHLPVYQWTN